MNQFFIEQSSVSGDSIVISGSSVNHIQNVLRLKCGEELQAVCPGNGLTYYCSIKSMDKNAVICTILDVQSESAELPAYITLYQGLPKGDKLEFVIQKAVELGASRIVPVSMKRSVMKIDPGKMGKKTDRWNAIAESAASQSKRSIVPEVSGVMNYRDALREAAEGDCILLPYELAEGMDESRRIMEDLRRQVTDICGAGKKPHIAIFIGPEGGFDESEIEEAKDCGAKLITLGRRILRTETAPLAILAWLTYLLDE